MRPETRDPRQSAEERGHNRDLWSRRPLAGWVKNAANKLLSRRLERRRLNRIQKEADHG